MPYDLYTQSGRETVTSKDNNIPGTKLPTTSADYANYPTNEKPLTMWSKNERQPKTSEIGYWKCYAGTESYIQNSPK